MMHGLKFWQMIGEAVGLPFAAHASVWIETTYAK